MLAYNLRIRELETIRKLEERDYQKNLRKMPSLRRVGFDLFYFFFTHRGWDRRQSGGKGQACVRRAAYLCSQSVLRTSLRSGTKLGLLFLYLNAVPITKKY